MIDKDKLKAIELAVAKLDKQFSPGTVMFANQKIEKADVYPTNVLPIDLATGIGGIPRGRITEIYGTEGVGKSLIAQMTVAACQRAGGLACYIDMEHALDPEWAEYLGVDMENLLVAQPMSGEEALEVADTLIKTGEVDLVVVDSIHALVPQAVLDGEMTDQTMASQARLMGKGLQKINPYVGSKNCALLFINQLRSKVGPMPGTDTPGGKAVKYYASLRIELKKISNVTNSLNQVTGANVQANIVKNKLAPPMKKVEFQIIHGKGVDNAGYLIEQAVKKGIIRKGGSYYYLEGEEKSFAQGLAAASDYVQNDEKLYFMLEQKVRENA